MMLRMRLLSAGLLGLTLSAMTGCGLLHDLQPHRLQRLNRVEPMGSDAYQFSIPDPHMDSGAVKPTAAGQ